MNRWWNIFKRRGPRPSAIAPAAAVQCTYWLTRFMILRLLGFVYLAAFLVAARQIVPLIGTNGLLPMRKFLGRVRGSLGSTKAGFRRLPSLFWWKSSDAALLAAAWTGVALSAVVLCGWANALVLVALWVLYMSFVHAGQDWYGYGWETQLLETGFLAIFLCQLLDGRPFPRRAPPRVVICLFRWLIFRIMIGAGMIKVRGDPCWRDLTALDYHFETQPLPNPLSRWFHFLPKGFLRLGVIFNHVAELVAPWFIFGPRTAMRGGGGVIVLFQGMLILSGNLSFLNWLTIVPGLACLDDAAWAKVLPRSLVRRAGAATGQPSLPQEIVAFSVAGLVLVLSIKPVSNLFSRHQIMNTSFDSLNLVNTYGAFGTVGRERFNVIFEGTASDAPDETAEWTEYLHKGLPVDPVKMPPQVAPYQLRLDWQMWFAAMSGPERYPWTLHLIWKLLHNDAQTLSLFAANPFPDTPPRYIRAVLYRYSFARPGNAEGAWWHREKLGLWLRPLSAADPGLISLLRRAGWLEPAETLPAKTPPLT